MEMIVIGWLVFDMTDSAWLVAFMGFCRSIPYLVVGVWSGLIIDRFGRRNIILVAQTINVLISITVAFLLWTEELQIWQIAAAALLMGSVWALDWPARRSLVPDLVGKEQTLDALIIENMLQNVSRIFGPFTGGALIATLGASSSYTILSGIAGLALLSLFGLTREPISRANMPAGISPWTRIVEGFRYVRRNQALMGVMWVTVIMNALAFPYMDLLPVFARDVLHQGPFELGILGAASGIGSFIGLFVINRIRHIFSNGWILLVGTCFQCIVLVAFASSTNFLLSFGLLIVVGMGHSIFGVMQSAILLLEASDEMRSRAMGSLTLFIGMGPAGRLQLGVLAQALSAPLAVGIHGFAGVVALGLVAYLLPDFRRRKNAPLALD